MLPSIRNINLLDGNETWKKIYLVCGIGPSAAETTNIAPSLQHFTYKNDNKRGYFLHLRRTSDHILNVIGMTRTVHMGIVSIIVRALKLTLLYTETQKLTLHQFHILRASH